MVYLGGVVREVHSAHSLVGDLAVVGWPVGGCYGKRVQARRAEHCVRTLAAIERIHQQLVGLGMPGLIRERGVIGRVHLLNLYDSAGGRHIAQGVAVVLRG